MCHRICNRICDKGRKKMKLYNIKEASEALGLKENTLRVWIMNRKIPYTKVGRAVRFTEEQLKAVCKPVDSRNEREGEAEE